LSDTLFESKDLHAYYASSHILHGIDFKILPGQSVALMGRNGMGKTTLLKNMLGLIKPRHGQVLVRGDDVTGLPAYKIASQGISYVPEGRGIFPNLTVLENLLMAARRGLNGQCDWTLDVVLRTFPRLKERLKNGGDQLSGGEQQMLTIARALMTNPDLLILDEATEGLAPIIAREIWNIVAQIRQSGIATILVDKNHAALTQLTDRAVILLKGRVVFDGPSQELRVKPELIQQYLGV
jgi:branched-chain amino acid transport system ATP-binding protein